MNKKVIIGIIAVIIVVAVIIGIVIGGKNSGKEENNLERVKIPLQIDFLERTVTAMIGYPKDKGIVVEDTESDTSKVFKNEGENYTLDISLTEDSTFKDNKEYAAEDEDNGYEEVKFGDFTGYITKGTYDIDGCILLEDLGDQNAYIYLKFEVCAIETTVDDKDVKPMDLYKLEDVQKILNTIKYDKGENTVEDTKNKIEEKEEEEKTTNYGEFAERSREDGTSDKDGLIFIPSFKSPDEKLFRAEQRNDNVGVDNDLWYISDKSGFTDSCIEVRVFPKSGTYKNIDEYKKEKGDMYKWSKEKIAGKEYDIYQFGSNPTKPEKYSVYYTGAFMVGERVVEFSYNMFKEIPDQSLGDKFFKQIIDSIEYSKVFK